MKTKITILALVLTAAAVVAVKFWFFPSVKDRYFALDERSLKSAPAGMLIVRPTHFAFLREKGVLGIRQPGSKNTIWRMGRNAPLRDVMAAGYGWDPERVELPADAPTNHFDFLMTGTSNQVTEFQAVLRRKLGYVAKLESRSTDVLALKIANPALPAFTVSGPDEQRRIYFQKKEEKLYFTHIPFTVLVEIFGHFFNTPMVDKTDATNKYDFAIAWNSKTDQDYNAGTMTREQVNKILGSLGLKLEPDTAPVEMLVVKKAD
jgi:uncharacterized protein (TIGR03435 family)